MKHAIRTSEELGMVIRAVRKSTHIRQDDLAGMVGVSRQFAVDVEKGKPTIQLGRTLRLLRELGIELNVEIPQAASEELEVLRQRAQARRSAAPSGDDLGTTKGQGPSDKVEGSGP